MIRQKEREMRTSRIDQRAALLSILTTIAVLIATAILSAFASGGWASIIGMVEVVLLTALALVGAAGAVRAFKWWLLLLLIPLVVGLINFSNGLAMGSWFLGFLKWLKIVPGLVTLYGNVFTSDPLDWGSYVPAFFGIFLACITGLIFWIYMLVLGVRSKRANSNQEARVQE